MRVIGVDCATDPKNVGLALADIGDRGVTILEVAVGATEPKLDRWIVERLPVDDPVPCQKSIGADRANAAEVRCDRRKELLAVSAAATQSVGSGHGQRHG